MKNSYNIKECYKNIKKILTSIWYDDKIEILFDLKQNLMYNLTREEIQKNIYIKVIMRGGSCQ